MCSLAGCMDYGGELVRDENFLLKRWENRQGIKSLGCLKWYQISQSRSSRRRNRHV